MKQVILMPIRPIHLVKILNGEKTIEIRKTLAKGDEIWFYCTKAKPLVAPFMFTDGWKYRVYNENTHYAGGSSANTKEAINGKIVAKCKVDKVEKIKLRLQDSVSYDDDREYEYETATLKLNDLLTKSCLTYAEIHDYLDYKEFGYAYHLKDLVIFDKPKELKECKATKVIVNVPFDINANDMEFISFGEFIAEASIKSQNEDDTINKDNEFENCNMPFLTKAPQSWQYVWVKE